MAACRLSRGLAEFSNFRCHAFRGLVLPVPTARCQPSKCPPRAGAAEPHVGASPPASSQRQMKDDLYEAQFVDHGPASFRSVKQSYSCHSPFTKARLSQLFQIPRGRDPEWASPWCTRGWLPQWDPEGGQRPTFTGLGNSPSARGSWGRQWSVGPHWQPEEGRGHGRVARPASRPTPETSGSSSLEGSPLPLPGFPGGLAGHQGRQGLWAPQGLRPGR